MIRKAIVLSAVLLGICSCDLGSRPAPYLVTLTPKPTSLASVSSPTGEASPTLPPPEVVVNTSTASAPTDTPGPTAIPAPTQTPGPSNTPAPTLPPPTPTPNWPEPLPAPGASKLGLHVIFNNDPRIMEFIRRVKPRVVKAVDNHGWLSEVKQVSPQTITLGRYTNVAEVDILSGKDPSQYPDPAAYAAQFINQYLNEYRLNPGVDYWEGWNEFLPKSPAEWNWFAQFEAQRACQMNDLGLKAAIGGFSTGTPEYSDMAYFLPAIEAAKRCNGIFTLHEYSSPTLQTGFNGGIPNAANVSNAGSLTFRYRYWYEGYLKPRNLVIPLVLSEVAVASNVGAGCPKQTDGPGWTSCQKDWEALGLGGDPVAAYINQLAWYDSEVRKDDYVLGFTIFAAGAPDSGLWKTFGINDILVPLAAYVASQP